MSSNRTMIGAPDPDDFSLENLLHTLDISRRSLPYGAHAVHYERLRHIEEIVNRYKAAPPPPPLPALKLSDAIFRPTQN